MATSSSLGSATTARSCAMRQLAQQRLRVHDARGQLGEVHLQHRQHLVDARQRHVALGEDALDARLGHLQLAGQAGVGDAAGAQLGLQRVTRSCVLLIAGLSVGTGR
jgi:hypothetical protein